MACLVGFLCTFDFCVPETRMVTTGLQEGLMMLSMSGKTQITKTMSLNPLSFQYSLYCANLDLRLDFSFFVLIMHSGHRIGTAEVESALASHPQCAEAAVVGVEHEVCRLSLHM